LLATIDKEKAALRGGFFIFGFSANAGLPYYRALPMRFLSLSM
jgi:hypothetical protein